MEWVHVGGTTVRMKIYFAPLEGVTTYIFRNAFAEIYGHVDKYFAPFISPSPARPESPTHDPSETRSIGSLSPGQKT